MENSSECCPKFDPTLWDEKIIEWKDKKFIKDKVFTLFYMPLNYGSVMTRITQKSESNGSKSVDGFCLSECTSMWNTNIYYAVYKDIPDAENITMSGKYLCKVFEGDFSKTGEWIKSYNEYAIAKGHTTQTVFMWYTTCPKCAKKYGKNYVVLIGKIS